MWGAGFAGDFPAADPNIFRGSVGTVYRRPDISWAKLVPKQGRKEAPMNSLDLLDALVSLVIVNPSLMVGGIGHCLAHAGEAPTCCVE